jgi:hypothetical protein
MGACSGPRVALEAPDRFDGLADLGGAFAPSLRFELVGKAHRTIVGDVLDDIGGPLDAHPPFAFGHHNFARLENSHTHAPEDQTCNQSP